ncbi:MAG: type II toxin-antitoxin system RelE/ParE family toxin [Candidatus Aminicenantes bacterium]|nr:type II toxin-antitoxin system RelE/ParE family toxin [Candidatus Aminicenantes bacterium]
MKRFRSRGAEQLLRGRPIRRLPPDIQRRARMRLQRVVAATALTDLRVPPSHRLESLRGDRTGQYSIRINDQWRVCFRWTDHGAMEIEIVDYH